MCVTVGDFDDLFCLHISQGQGPYAEQLKKIEGDIKEIQKRINEKLGTP
jgi:hypothetical protein